MGIYSISFFPESDDVYGKDIDLAGRLQSVAKSRQIVINRAFYERVKAAFEKNGNNDDFTCVRRIV